MNVEIIHPEYPVYKGVADSITLPGIDGGLGILNGHAPLISALTKGKIKLENNMGIQNFDDANGRIAHDLSKDGKTLFIQINGGTVEVSNNKVIILAE